MFDAKLTTKAGEKQAKRSNLRWPDSRANHLRVPELNPLFCESCFGALKDAHHRLELRVVFPLTGPGKPPGRKSPKNGEKVTKFPSPARRPKMGKIAPKKG